VGALIAGLGLLWVLAAMGAALVHLVEYHVGLGSSGGRLDSMRFMLAHCPVRGGLLVALIATVLTLFAVWRELRSLLGQQRRLILEAHRLQLAASHGPAPTMPLPMIRFVALLASILAGQAGLYALTAHLWPMISLMRMHGAWMYMEAPGALPLLPLHLVVAVALAALAWRLERRFTVLRAAIAAVRRAVARALSALLRVPLPSWPHVSWLHSYCVPAALSRPPPN
jgi:hypothetical protein